MVFMFNGILTKLHLLRQYSRCMKSSVQREKAIRNFTMIFRNMLNKEVRNEDVK